MNTQVENHLHLRTMQFRLFTQKKSESGLNMAESYFFCPRFSKKPIALKHCAAAVLVPGCVHCSGPQTWIGPRVSCRCCHKWPFSIAMLNYQRVIVRIWIWVGSTFSSKTEGFRSSTSHPPNIKRIKHPLFLLSRICDVTPYIHHYFVRFSR